VSPMRLLGEWLHDMISDLTITAAVVVMAALLLCSHGCATGGPLPTPGLRDGSEKAAAIIWHVYGRTDLPPVIHWVQGKDLTCTDPDSGEPGFPQMNEKGEPVCHEGLTLTPWSCYVAWTGQPSFSDTALAHELLHVAQFRAGILDPRHERPEWTLLVPRANAALVENGL